MTRESTVEWINALTASKTSIHHQHDDNHISMIQDELDKKRTIVQLEAQELASSLQLQMNHLQRFTPTLPLQLDQIHQALLRLQTTCSSNSTTGTPNPMGNTPQENDSSMMMVHSYLSRLHRMKNRMHECAESMQISRQWEMNIKILDQTLRRQDYVEASHTFLNLRESVESMTKLTPEHDHERRLLSLNEYRERINEHLFPLANKSIHGSSTSPPMVTAGSQEEAQVVLDLATCCTVFQNLDQIDTLVDLWTVAKQKSTHSWWYAKSSSSSLTEPLVNELYDKVRHVLEMERQTDIQAFVPTIVFHLYQHLVEPLEDSIQSRLQVLSSSSEIVQMFRHSCQCAIDVSDILCMDKNPPTTNRSAEISVPDVWKLQLGPFTNSWKEKFPTHVQEHLKEDFHRILEGVFDLTSKIATREFVHAKEELDDDDDELFGDHDASTSHRNSDTTSSFEYFIDQLEHQIADTVQPLLERVFSHCLALTHGAGLSRFQQAMNAGLNFYWTQFQEHFRDHYVQAQVQQEGPISYSQKDDQPPPPPSMDWTEFQTKLKLLQVVGIMENQMHSLDHKLTIESRERATALLLSLESEPTMIWPSAFTLELGIQYLAQDWLRLHVDIQEELRVSFCDTRCSSSSVSRRWSFFEASSESYGDWKHDVVQLVFDHVVQPVQAKFKTLSQLAPVWNNQPSSSSFLDLPLYTPLPQEYITSAADVLLSLLPQLEPWSRTSVTAFQQPLVKLVKAEWQKVAQALDEQDWIETQETMLDMMQLSTNEHADNAGQFVDLWTHAVGSATVASAVHAIVHMSTFSEDGLEQLSVDLAYLKNVLQALGNPVHPLLSLVQEIVAKKSPEEVQEHLASVEDREDTPVRRLTVKLVRLLAQKRGILD